MLINKQQTYLLFFKVLWMFVDIMQKLLVWLIGSIIVKESNWNVISPAVQVLNGITDCSEH